MAGSYLRQSTASQSRATPPFLDDTDFKTAETGLTIANTDVKLIVNGGASADKNSGGGTHRANGVYGLTFDATDTATVGEMEVSIKVAGALPVFMKFWILEEAVYDALFAASAPGYLQPTTAGRTLDVSAGGEAGIDWANVGSQTTSVNLSGTTVNLVNTATTVTNAVSANVTQISGDTTAADNAEAFFDGTGYAGTNNVIPTVTTVTNAVSANVTQISGDTTAADNCEAFFDGTGYAGTNNVIPTVTNVATVGTVTNIVSANVTQISGDATAADNAEAFFDGTGYAGTNNVIPTVTTVTAVSGAVGSVTGNVGGNVTGSVGSLAAQAKADVNAEVLDVFVTDTFAEPSAPPAATASLKDKIGWMQSLHRNKRTQTATTELVRNDADNATIGTSTKSDDGATYTRGKYS